MRRNVWNTYRVTAYTHHVGEGDPRSQGGVHLHQVRRTRSGWQTRICQSNGRFQSLGETRSVSAAQGESLFDQAKRSC